MCVNEKELLYLFSTIVQALAAILGIGIIAVAYVNEKSKATLTRLWNLADGYWKSQNFSPVTLYNHGIVTTEQLLDFIERNLSRIEKKKPEVHARLLKTLAEYKAQPKIEKALFYISLLCAALGMTVAVVGLIFSSELSNTEIGSFLAIITIFIFIGAIVLFTLLIFRAILPKIARTAEKKSRQRKPL